MEDMNVLSIHRRLNARDGRRLVTRWWITALDAELRRKADDVGGLRAQADEFKSRDM